MDTLRTQQTATNNLKKIIPKGGCMGDLIRSFDWSTTELGPIESWPQSLITITNTCLSSCFPFLIWWGKDLTAIYNDAYIPILAARHPHALGKSGLKVWGEPDLWAVIGPNLYHVLSEGEATWSEDELLLLHSKGQLQECYFTWSYSPIYAEQGKIAGVLTSVTEVTAQVLNARRLKEMRKLTLPASFVEREQLVYKNAIEREKIYSIFMQAPVGITLLRGPTHICELCNEKALSMMDGRNIKDQAIKDAFPEIPESEIYSILDEVYQTGKTVTLTEMPVHKVTPTVNSQILYVDCVYQPWFGSRNEIAGVLIIAVDVTERVVSRLKLEESELRYQLMSLATRDSIWDWDITTGSIKWNNVIHTEYKYPTNTNAESITWWIKLIHPEDKDRILDSVRKTLNEGNTHWFGEYRFKIADGSYINVFDRGYVVHDAANKPIRMIGAMQDMTVQRKAEDLLRHSEERLRSIFQQAIVGFAETDFNGQFTLVNDHFCKMVGRPRESLLQLKVHEITHADDKAHNEELFEELTSKGKSFTIEKRFIKPDGSFIWVHNSVSPIDDQSAIAVIIDISEQKAMEVKLQESENYFRTLVDNSPAILWMTDVNTECTYLSHQGYEFTGCTRDKDLKKWWCENLHPEDLATIYQYNLFPDGKPVSFTMEYRLRSKNGQYRWVLGSGNPRFDRDQNFLGHIGTVVDIHDQKVLQESREAEFRSLANSMAQLSWIANAEGIIFWYNQRWYDFTGTILEDMKTKGWGNVIHPDHYDRVMIFIDQAWKKEQPWELTFPLRCHSGNWRWFLTRAMPIRNMSGKLLRWFGTHTDITDQKQTQEALQEALKARDEFLSIASHELKTPIPSLKLLLQMTERQMKATNEKNTLSPEKLFKALNSSMIQVDRLTSLVDDLLDVSRIQSGKMVFWMDKTNLSVVTREVIEQFSEQIEEASCPLKLFIQDDIICECDRGRIEQVIVNLISNAIKYAPGEQITIHLAKKNQEIELIVKDNGLGIPEETQSKIFERFERSTLTRSISGLGLGLFIVKQIVMAHKGNIKVSSIVGKGAAFTVTLPVHHNARSLYEKSISR